MLWRPPSPKKARSKSHFQDQQPSPYCTDVKAWAHISKSPDPICQAKVTITVRQAIEEENEPPAPPLKVDKRDKCTSTIRNLSHHVLEWKIHSPGHRSSRRDDAQSQAGPPVTTVWQGISLSICLLQSIRKGNCGKARDEALNNDQVLSSVSKMHFIIRYHLYHLYTYIYNHIYVYIYNIHVASYIWANWFWSPWLSPVESQLSCPQDRNWLYMAPEFFASKKDHTFAHGKLWRSQVFSRYILIPVTIQAQVKRDELVTALFSARTTRMQILFCIS